MEGYWFSTFFGSTLMAVLVGGIAYAATDENSLVGLVVGAAAFLSTGWFILTRS